MPGGIGEQRDHRGSRRLGGAEQAFWYAAAAVSYVILSLWHKWLLNWFVGPLWLVVVVTAGPSLVDRVRRR
jgi:energy-converting hydrogenase Eha subunit G